MRRLFTIDYQDYEPDWPRFVRPSVRGIIRKDDKIALVHHGKSDYYRIPGGGIEPGKSLEEALVREVKEETGLVVIPESIKELGKVLRLSACSHTENMIFEQENYYYVCEAEDEVEAPELDTHEIEEQYSLVFTTLEEAVHRNRHHDHGADNGAASIERETRVLELLLMESKK